MGDWLLPPQFLKSFGHSSGPDKGEIKPFVSRRYPNNEVLILLHYRLYKNVNNWTSLSQLHLLYFIYSNRLYLIHS